MREPEPIPAAGHLLFPDFAVQPRGEPGRRWLVEIVGFWTSGYLARKLAGLREARIENLVLCIDEARNVGEGEVPPGARVVRYRRRVDPLQVLAATGAGAAHAPGPRPDAAPGVCAGTSPGHGSSSANQPSSSSVGVSAMGRGGQVHRSRASPT